LEDLREAGVRDVAIILGNLAPERVVEHYGDGSWLGMNLTYIYQGYPYGIAHAVYLARDFVGDKPFVVYLGDNVILEGIARALQLALAIGATQIAETLKKSQPGNNKDPRNTIHKHTTTLQRLSARAHCSRRAGDRDDDASCGREIIKGLSPKRKPKNKVEELMLSHKAFNDQRSCALHTDTVSVG
jgi:hypothetical protein